MTINLVQARELLPEAVETMGRDFVYNPGRRYDCLYEPIPEGGRSDASDPRHLTGCVVGVAISLTGETRHIGKLKTVSTLHWEFPDMLTGGAAEYLNSAQSAQDGGKSWGEAYDIAERQLWERLTDGNFDVQVVAEDLPGAVTELLAKQAAMTC